MRIREAVSATVAAALAAGAIATGILRLPQRPSGPLTHPPVIVYAEPELAPLVVEARRALPSLHHLPKLSGVAKFTRRALARALPVTLTQYCLQGTTRRDHPVRPGIVAADPQLFPLAHYVEIFLGRHYLGRYLVDDTGGKVKGATLDIWTPSCSEARRFGRQTGTAMLVVKPEH